MSERARWSLRGSPPTRVDIQGRSLGLRLFKQGMVGAWMLYCDDLRIEGDIIAPADTTAEAAVRRALEVCGERAAACVATVEAMKKEMDR